MPRNGITLTERIIDTVGRIPKCSAWVLADELQASSATVSGTLHRLAKQGRVVREQNSRGTWVYKVVT